MQNELIIVVVSAVFGGLITYVITRYFKQRKSLAYQVFCERSLINISPRIKDKIKVEWDGAPLQDVSSFKVRVINDGNLAIKTQQILFSFEEGSWIVDWDYSTNPSKEFGNIVRMEKKSNPHEQRILVELINPKEEIDLNFLMADTKSDILNMYAKAENLRFHKRLGSKARWQIVTWCVGGAFLASFGWYLVTKDPTPAAVPASLVVVAILAPVMLTLLVLMERKFRS